MRSYPHLLDRQARLAAVLTALGVVAVFAVALCLKPNVGGTEPISNWAFLSVRS